MTYPRYNEDNFQSLVTSICERNLVDYLSVNIVVNQ